MVASRSDSVLGVLVGGSGGLFVGGEVVRDGYPTLSTPYPLSTLLLLSPVALSVCVSCPSLHPVMASCVSVVGGLLRDAPVNAQEAHRGQEIPCLDNP